MSRIVITTIGSLGDLHPKIAIAIELRQRGHDIVLATHKGYKPKLKPWGLSFTRCTLTDPQLRHGCGYYRDFDNFHPFLNLVFCQSPVISFMPVLKFT